MAEPVLRTTAPAAHVESLRAQVEVALSGIELPDEPRELYEPIRYVLSGGGKRLRPVLVLLANEACGGVAETAMPAALAVEVFHNFTLVHDDIMDAARERRGRPTVHVVWDEGTAILAGDLLMGLSYELLARSDHPDVAALVRTFHRMVAAVCEGQALDAAFERRPLVSVDDYLSMITRKTGALIECAAELGARLGGGDGRTVDALSGAAHDLGRAFQIQDDLLDLVASDDKWGKRIGGDLVQGKKTYLLLRSLEVATGEDKAFFEEIVVSQGLASEHVVEARGRMESLGVLDETRAVVERHCRAAVEALESLPPTDARETLIWLARSLASRAH